MKIVYNIGINLNRPAMVLKSNSSTVVLLSGGYCNIFFMILLNLLYLRLPFKQDHWWRKLVKAIGSSTFWTVKKTHWDVNGNSDSIWRTFTCVWTNRPISGPVQMDSVVHAVIPVEPIFTIDTRRLTSQRCRNLCELASITNGEATIWKNWTRVRWAKRSETTLADRCRADNGAALRSCQIDNILLQWTRRRRTATKAVSLFTVAKCCKLGAVGQCSF